MILRGREDVGVFMGFKKLLSSKLLLKVLSSSTRVRLCKISRVSAITFPSCPHTHTEECVRTLVRSHSAGKINFAPITHADSRSSVSYLMTNDAVALA